MNLFVKNLRKSVIKKSVLLLFSICFTFVVTALITANMYEKKMGAEEDVFSGFLEETDVMVLVDDITDIPHIEYVSDDQDIPEVTDNENIDDFSMDTSSDSNSTDKISDLKSDVDYDDYEKAKPDYTRIEAGKDYVEHQVVLHYEDLEAKQELERVLSDHGVDEIQELRDGILVSTVPEGKSVEEYSDEIAELEIGVMPSPDYIYTLCEDEVDRIEPEVEEANDEYVGEEWYLPYINAYDAWDCTNNGYNAGDGVKVAILDTGVDYGHSDLDDNIVFTASTSDGDPLDYNGHGTHVAGIVAMETNNAIGGAGVAPGAELYCIDVFTYMGIIDGEHKFGASTTDLVEGIDLAVQNGVDVINMSLGGSSPSAAIEQAINDATSAGVVCVAAAGNENTTTPHYPSDYENCISVISVDDDDTRSSFSNYGSGKDISAPGSYIFSTYSKYSLNLPDNDYIYMSGTSMASPVVAGVVALILDAYQNITVSGVKEILYNSARDVGASGWDTEFGYGIVDAKASVDDIFYISNGELINYRGNETNVIIPDGVTSIGEMAFYNRDNITSVTIPEGVVSIGDSVFNSCTSLSNVNLPTTLGIISDSAFGQCSSLEEIKMLKNVTNINPNSFNGCAANFTIIGFAGSIADSYATANGYNFEALIEQVEVTCQIKHCSVFGVSDGEIYATGIYGSGYYEYSIDGGENWQDENLFSNVSEGTYEITVRDTQNTSFTGSVTVVVNSKGVYDLNDDNMIDLADLTIASEHYNSTSSTCDFNGDGIVNIYDLILLVKEIDYKGS